MASGRTTVGWQLSEVLTADRLCARVDSDYVAAAGIFAVVFKLAAHGRRRRWRQSPPTNSMFGARNNFNVKLRIFLPVSR